MYSVNIPNINEKLSIGNEFYGVTVLEISTTDSYNHTREQKEVRIVLKPISIEFTHYAKWKIVFALRVFNKSVSLGFEYGKSETY